MRFKLMIIYRIGLIFLIIALEGCLSGNSENLLQPASGKPGDIFLVMDSAKWAGELGAEIKNTFQADVKGLPRKEPLFKLIYINPLKLNSVLKNAKNMIFVTSLESSSRETAELKRYFTKGSLEQINRDSTLFYKINKNVFAKGQEVIYLFGKTDKQLIRNIKQNGNRVINYLNSIERNRLIYSLYGGLEQKGINKRMLQEYNYWMRIPNGYNIAIWEDEFIWLRNPGVGYDKNLFITYKNYTDEKQLTTDSIIEWRNRITKKYIYEDPENPKSFVVTETLVPPFGEIISFNDKYTNKVKGLWKTNNLSMGGPFVSYVFVDQQLARLFYVDGFLYSPGKDQREFMRELETIIETFRTATEKRAAS